MRIGRCRSRAEANGLIGPGTGAPSSKRPGCFAAGDSDAAQSWLDSAAALLALWPFGRGGPAARRAMARRRTSPARAYWHSASQAEPVAQTRQPDSGPQASRACRPHS